MINDYQSLVSTIKSYLHRGDLDELIPTFIQFAETRFNRNLRVRQMEKRATVATTDEYSDLPTDWLEFIGDPTSGEDQYSFLPRDAWFSAYTDRVYGRNYTIVGNRIYASYDVSNPGTLDFTYYAKIPSLSELTPTNWLIVDAPDAYLYGALLEAEPYIKNDKRLEIWRGFLQVAMNDLQTSSDKARFSGGALVIGVAR